MLQSLTTEQAQMLSYLSIVLFVITFVCIIVGTHFELKRRAIHIVAYLAFSACGILNGTCTVLYFWHRWYR